MSVMRSITFGASQSPCPANAAAVEPWTPREVVREEGASAERLGTIADLFGNALSRPSLPPAFRQDGTPIAERTAHIGVGTMQLRVLPFTPVARIEAVFTTDRGRWRGIHGQTDSHDETEGSGAQPRRSNVRHVRRDRGWPGSRP